MYHPKISIITPVFNVEEYVGKCIKSILNQSFKNFELILINDGSTDDSGTICDYYASLDNRIKVFHTKNKGQAAARNHGIKIARGEYIGFVDSDDWIERNMFSLLYNYCVINDSDISIIGVREINESGTCLSEYIPNNVTFHSILRRAYPWNKLFKKELFIRNKLFFKEGKYYEDLELIPKLFIKSQGISSITEVAYNYLKRGNSTTANRDGRILDNLWAYTEIKKFLMSEDIYSTYSKEFEKGVIYFRVFYINLLYDYSSSFLLKNSFRLITDFNKIGGLGKKNCLKLLGKHLKFSFLKSGSLIKKLLPRFSCFEYNKGNKL
ncbi:glycosyltransferase family 2 protein [Halobacillus amylolyticus]|uniref:Glycosyltransferase n=1 Tax=Halobacillus amylolyticus TaxID=2932259 RepID=A0ABY4HHA8_9BACI|nr:glycosyltransferase family 2 protein [Halobacillus amylolyticus]UOR13783.1 glycosyltransferase [Halobacillus amylolyticus]